jgi:hypothetical protein
LDARLRRKVEAFEAAIGEVLTREQILVLLSAAARTGSVSAAKTLLEELRRDDGPAQPGDTIFSVIDEIAAKRRQQSSL